MEQPVSGQVDQVAVIPDCEADLKQRSICPVFSASFMGLLEVCRMVFVHVASGGFWGSHTLRVRMSLPKLSIFNRWRLLREPFYAAST